MKSITIEKQYFDGKSPDQIEDMLRLWLQKSGFDKDMQLKFIQHDDGSLTVTQDGFYTCRKCGKQDGSVVIHHIYSKRTHPKLRNHAWNHIPLCYNHHCGSSEFSAHATPALFLEWVMTYEGIGGIQWLELQILVHQKVNNNKEMANADYN